MKFSMFKFLNIFFLVLTFSVLVDLKITRKSHKSNKSLSSDIKEDNHSRESISGTWNFYNPMFFQFVTGTLSLVPGRYKKNIHSVEKCLNELDESEQIDKDELSSKYRAEKMFTILDEKKWDSIDELISGRENAINVVCIIKDKIYTLFEDRKRIRRSFLEGKKNISKNSTTFKWSFSHVWFQFQHWYQLSHNVFNKPMEEALEKPKKDRKKMVVKIKGVQHNMAKARGKKLFIFIKDKIEFLFDSIGKALDKLKFKIVNWMKSSPIMLKYQKLVECLITTLQEKKHNVSNPLQQEIEDHHEYQSKKDLEIIFSRLKAFSTLLSQLYGEEWIKFVIDMICNHTNLKNFVANIKKTWSLQKPNDRRERYFQYGQAIGNIMIAITEID